MDSAQTFLISCLAFCPSVILFGPILYRIAKTPGFDHKLHAISTLRDFDGTNISFLIWMLLYMISQLVYTLLILRFIVDVPVILYISGLSSLIFGVIAFIFVSTSKKHVFLAGLSALSTLFSVFGFAIVLVNVDLYFALSNALLGLAMLTFLLTTTFKGIRFWLAEYLGLGVLSIWNIAVLLKAIS